MGALENNCVTVEIALLSAQAALSGFSIVSYDDDDQAEKDRIVVTAQPRQVEIYDRLGADAILHRVQVDVEIILATRSVSALDTYILAVEQANTGSNPAAAAVTLALALFPADIGGLTIRQTDDGNREGEGTNARKRTKSFLFIGNELGAASDLLLESGDALLLESGDILLLEG